MDSIRVLHVVPAMNCGGMETFIMNIYRNIDRSKVQFDFLYHYQVDSFYDEEILSLGGRIYKLSVRNDNNFVKYCRDLDLFFRTHKEYRVVHGHYSGFGMFYFHYARKYGVPCRVGHSHSDKYEEGLIGQLDRFMSKPFRYGLTDRFACSEAAGKFLFGKYPFDVCLNGIDVQTFLYSEESRRSVREKYGLADSDIVLGHVGRFDPVKNHSFLMKIFAKLHAANPKFRLMLIGDGVMRGDAEKLAKELGVYQAVCFAGLQKNTALFYSAFDHFLLPSNFEGIPLSLIEAQANGLNCIVSDNVNPVANVTGNVHMIPLNVQEWSDRIAGMDHRRCMDADEKVRVSGYDIRENALKLQKFYLSKYEDANA